MKIFSFLTLIFLSLCILNVNVHAQQSTGSTVINATVTGILELNFYPTYPEIFVPEDYYFYENLTLSKGDLKNISVYLNKTDGNNFVKFVNRTENDTYYQDVYTQDLQQNMHKNVTLRVYVPSGMGFEGGTYYVPIYATSLTNNRSNSTTLKIRVNTTNPIDDIEVVNLYPSSLYSGESLNVDISIHKIYPTETTDIQICYCINSNPSYQCGPAYNNYGCSWKAITEWLNYTKTVTVNEGPGEYYFIVAVKYPGDENIKRANSPKFYVRSTPSEPTGPGAGPPTFVTPTQPKLKITTPNYLEASPGEMVRFGVEIGNEGNAKAFNTTLNMYGIPEGWVSITPGIQDIKVGESKNYSVLISLPGDAYEQIYSLSLVAKSGSVDTTEIITMTVAMTLKKRAEFLLEEARSRKREAEEIIKRAEDLGMDTTEQERLLVVTNDVLEEAQGLFESGDYGGSVEKAKQAIEGYKSVISSVKEMVEKAYLLLMDEITAETGRIESLTEERDVIEFIKEKVNQSLILRREKRIIGAYETLLEAKQLLDQLKDKIFFMGFAQQILAASVVVIIIISVFMLMFYKKMLSRFMKIMIIEEQKRRLRHLFRREVRPSIEYREMRMGRRKLIWEKIKRKLKRKRYGEYY